MLNPKSLYKKRVHMKKTTPSHEISCSLHLLCRSNTMEADSRIQVLQKQDQLYLSIYCVDLAVK